jgi:hypothetical protein
MDPLLACFGISMPCKELKVLQKAGPKFIIEG